MTVSMPPTLPGAPVHVRFTKFDGRPHWAYDGIVLGEDEHGVWTFFPVGTHASRPGASLVTDHPWVVCFPRDGWWAASFYADPKPVRVYVDVSTVPVWERGPLGEAVVRAVDLDLDVVVEHGTVFLDDEDEFEEHRLELSYPKQVEQAARASATSLLAAIRTGREPFGTVGEQWLARAASLP